MSDNHNKPDENGNGFLATIQAGIAALLGNASHQPLKKIRIADPIMVSVKTFLGGQGFAKADTTIEVEFNEEAAKLVAEGEKEAARIDAEASAEAQKIEAAGIADASRIAAEHALPQKNGKKE